MQAFALAENSDGLKTHQCFRDGLLNSPKAFYTARIILKYSYKSNDIKSMQFRKIEVYVWKKLITSNRLLKKLK
jgi:hypothetical protein